MRKYCKRLAAVVAGAAIALTFAAAPAMAADGDLEAKIQTLEQSLSVMKAQLQEMKASQQQQEIALAEKAAADKLPAWLNRISFYGDVRMRYQGTKYGDLNGKSKDDRNRFRVRLRFGVKSQISESWEIGFRMVSGANDDATSTNQTFGDYWGEKTAWGFDRAYVKYTPYQLNKMLQFTFGKAQNPYVSSKAIWDGDVVPEGATLKLTFNQKGNWQPFMLGSVMFLKEHKSDPPDDLYAYFGQLGVQGKAGKFKLLAATAYYDWSKLGEAGQIPPYMNGNVSWKDDNDETRMSKFKVWDLYAKASYKLAKKTSLGVWGHYLTNTDENAVKPYEGKDKGYAFGASLKWNKFKFSAWYKHVEANATPGFIADSDSSYVNRKGYVLGVDYKMFKYGVVKVAWYDTKPIEESFPGASNESQTLFVDFVFKF